jgi:2,3-dihydroxybenzoate-AMP ligase
MLSGCVPWPAEVAERYRREGYWRGEWLGDLLRPWASREPSRVALATRDRAWTYGELDAWADRLAAGFVRLGVGATDRVVVQLPNVPEFPVVAIALFRLGALPVFALPPHRRAEIGYLCESTDAVAYVVPERFQGFDYRDLARQVRAAVPGLKHVLVVGEPAEFTALASLADGPSGTAQPSPDPSDVAFFLLSGGTTGAPKLIPRTHDDYAYQIRATAAEMGHGSDDVYLAALPVAHNAALGCPGLLGTLYVGGKVVLATSASPDEVFPLMAREGVTLTTLMPPFVMLWTELAEAFGADLSGVTIEVGGAKLAPDVARRVRPVLGATLSHWFGIAEGMLSFTRPGEPDELAAVTQGRPLSPADEFRVVDEAGADVPAGQVGELLIRGPYTLRGYYRAAEHNARTFTEDGYFRTGDLVRVTPEGHLVVEGRVKDVINRGGEKVPPEEVEEHLLKHPAIRDVAVVAMPDEALGEKTCAFVVLGGDSPTLAQLAEFLRERGLADYKVPDRLEVVDAFPYTNVGKVSKKALRERIAGIVGAGGGRQKTAVSTSSPASSAPRTP